MSQQRKPRFRRQPEKDRHVQITPTDIAMFEQIARFNFLTVPHIAGLLDGSEQYISRRLYELFHAGYTRRPPSQIERYLYGGGSHKMAHGLSTKGYREIGWNKRTENTVTKDHIKHELLIADIVTAFEFTCRETKGLSFVDREHLSWKVDGTYNRKPYPFSVVPDYTFGVRKGDAPEGQNTWWFFLEADCGTMNVRRGEPFRSSIYRKLCAYWQTYQNGIHSKQFEMGNFRVLFVTTANHDRVKNMASACHDEEVGGGSKMFLFGQKDAFDKYNPLQYPWTNGKDDIPSPIID